MPIQFRWLSDEKVISTTSPTPIELLNTQSPLGPNGGRMVIDKVFLRIRGSLTVATAAWDGRDVPRLVSSVFIEHQDGTMRVSPISGAAHRLVQHRILGSRSYIEHANVAIGAAQAINLFLPFTFERPLQRRPWDYSMGCEQFKRLLFTPATLAQAQTGTTVLSAATLSAQLEFWGHEQGEVQHESKDLWTLIDFTSQNQVALQLTGPLQELYIVSTSGSTAGGGGLISGVSTVRIDALGLPPIEFSSVLAQYRTAQQRGNTSVVAVGADYIGDPITELRMFPCLPSNPEIMRPWDGLLAKTPVPVRVDITPAVAGMQVLVRCAQNRTRAQWDLANATFNVGTAASAKVKTMNGSPFDVSKGEVAFAPISVPLPEPIRTI